MPQDPHGNAADSLVAPAQTCFSITPSDLAELALVTKAIYVGTGGDVTLRTVRGNQDVTFRNVPTGSILDVRATAVRAAGTSADDIVGFA